MIVKRIGNRIYLPQAIFVFNALMCKLIYLAGALR